MTMTIAREWMLTYLCNAVWQIPFLWLAAALCVRLMRRVGPRAEHRVWVLALAGAAVAPGCSWPAIFAGVQSRAFARVTATIEPARVVREAGVPGWAMDAVWVAWLLYLVLALVRFACGLWRLHGVSERARAVLVSPGIREQWRQIAAEYGLQRARLGVSPEVAGPVAFGVRTPTVLLPVGLMGRLDAEELDVAMAHEAAHLARRDFAKHVCCTLLSLPVAMHPVTWLLRSRVAESREMVCDALAAETLGGAKRYAGALLRLAALLPGLPAAQDMYAIGMFDANTLERRLMRMIKQREYLSGIRRAGVCVFAGLLGFAAFSSALAMHGDIGMLAAEGGTGQVYSPGGEVTAPKIIYSVDPSFPKTAGKAAGGTCLLGLIVDALGNPENVHVVRSLRPDFDAAAMKAVRQYRFRPAVRKGEAVAVALKIEVNFQRF